MLSMRTKRHEFTLLDVTPTIFYGPFSRRGHAMPAARRRSRRGGDTAGFCLAFYRVNYIGRKLSCFLDIFGFAFGELSSVLLIVVTFIESMDSTMRLAVGCAVAMAAKLRRFVIWRSSCRWDLSRVFISIMIEYVFVIQQQTELGLGCHLGDLHVNVMVISSFRRTREIGRGISELDRIHGRIHVLQDYFRHCGKLWRDSEHEWALSDAIKIREPTPS